jgi:signal transduction histidine kinase
LTRRVNKYSKIIKGSLWLICLWNLFVFSSCSESKREEIDKLNDKSYSFHYKNIDSTKIYAQKALKQSNNYYDEGEAEALNNLAFVSIVRMDYSKAYELLKKAYTITDNQIELLVCDIQYMRLCLRESKNKDFYSYRTRALQRFKRINEESDLLVPHQKKRMIYAQSEFDIITSIYYYYVGLEKQSIQAMNNIQPDGPIQKDTAQFLNYLYNIGAGGIINKGNQYDINQQEFDYLMRCYIAAIKYDYPYWEANSLQALSEHLMMKSYRMRIMDENMPALKFLNIDNMPDSLLAGNLAQRALNKFIQYGDVYQIAGAWRTLAQCYWQIDDYRSAITCLEKALSDNKSIELAPNLVASIREQLSVVYSSLDDKPSSDFNRNIYLDLQEMTRQDRLLEARAAQLESSSDQLNLMITAVIVMIVLVILLLFLFNYWRHRSDRKYSIEKLLLPLQKWRTINELNINTFREKHELLNEEREIITHHSLDNKKRYLEQRAKISLVNNVTPFIDRIINEINRLLQFKEDKNIREERYIYIGELTDKINEYNSVLTNWIQLRQGELSLHIESFALQSLFDIVSKSRMGFQLNNIELCMKSTTDVVKADKILTLFMINTLADNARKFTSPGGKVSIYSKSTETYVEISVEDNGCGIDEEQIDHIFDRKIIINDNTNRKILGANPANEGHGFGLMNCKGIIEKYHKISHNVFNVCCISLESEKGKGSRFFFRLPKGVLRILLLTSLLSITNAKSYSNGLKDYMDIANKYANKAYYSNINGTYEQTLLYTDSSRMYINKYYHKLKPKGKDTLVLVDYVSSMPPEIKWFHDSLPVNYNIILDIRNEGAIAALALHKWNIYRYNNKIYTQLYKELSADNSLDTYCKIMQKSESNKTVAVILLVISLLLIFPAYYILYYRHLLNYKFCVEHVQRINDILLSNITDKEKLLRIEQILKNTINDKFPVSLQDIIEQIISALNKSIEVKNQDLINLEIAEDDLHRIQLENEKMYICNSVLDNCLSTLKHETMYYPSRIRQLVDGQDDNLNAIDELVHYYKELYTILSAQAMNQIKDIKQVCRKVQISELINVDNPTNIICDKDMLNYLFVILRKLDGDEDLPVNIIDKDNKYAIIHVIMRNIKLTELQCHQLFTPLTIDLRYLLCRQIIRDVGESTNARGCGIQAFISDEDNVVIEITLAKAS